MNGHDNFASFVEAERTRLNGEKDKLNEQITELTGQRDGVDRELSAISAYESARAGKTPAVVSGRGKNTQVATRASRRGSKREGLIALIAQNPQGLSRGDILEKMGLKGDKAGEMSVSNALTALTKNNTVVRNGGKYSSAAA